jgi:hypothetical protein
VTAVGTTVSTLHHPIPLGIQPGFLALAALVQARVDAVALFVQATLVAFATLVDLGGRLLVAVRIQALGTVVCVLLHRVATAVQALVDGIAALVGMLLLALAALIHALVDAPGAVLDRGLGLRQGRQQRGTQGQRQVEYGFAVHAMLL